MTEIIDIVEVESDNLIVIDVALTPPLAPVNIEVFNPTAPIIMDITSGGPPGPQGPAGFEPNP